MHTDQVIVACLQEIVPDPRFVVGACLYDGQPMLCLSASEPMIIQAPPPSISQGQPSAANEHYIIPQTNLAQRQPNATGHSFAQQVIPKGNKRSKKRSYPFEEEPGNAGMPEVFDEQSDMARGASSSQKDIGPPEG